MHTVELLQEALEAARGLGYDVRQDWLGGDGGGHCLVRGRRMLLLDVAQSPDEQLDVVADALRGEVRDDVAQDFAAAGRAAGERARPWLREWPLPSNAFAVVYNGRLLGGARRLRIAVAESGA